MAERERIPLPEPRRDKVHCMKLLGQSLSTRRDP
ncbi:MAG: hypothetical protein ACJAQV_000069 [Loktanella salsilacus]|jgi:hypothetical protein